MKPQFLSALLLAFAAAQDVPASTAELSLRAVRRDDGGLKLVARVPPKGGSSGGNDDILHSKIEAMRVEGKPPSKTDANKAKNIDEQTIKKFVAVAETSKNAEITFSKKDPDYKFQPGESGYQIKTGSDGRETMVIYYGDDMAHHAWHVELHGLAYPKIKGQSWKAREGDFDRSTTNNNPEYKKETLGLGKEVVLDENPMASWDYLEGAFTLVAVPMAESRRQGSAESHYTRFLEGNGARVTHLDNRSDKDNIPPQTSRLYIRGPKIPGVMDPKFEHGTALKDMSKADQKRFASYLQPLEKEQIAYHLRKGIFGDDDSDTEMSDAKRSIRRALLNRRDTDQSSFLMHAPMYNIMMPDDIAYSAANIQKFMPEDDVNSTTSKRSLPDHSWARQIGILQGGETNAGDSNQMDDADVIAALFALKYEAQNNASVILQPYIDAVFNGSSSPMAEAQAWNLFSMLSPSVSYMGPFSGTMDSLENTTTDAGLQNAADTLASFNAFTYNRAAEAVNATGLLQTIGNLDLALSTFNDSSFPAEFTTVDSHLTVPFMDYVTAWNQYNGLPTVISANSTNTTWGTPDWVWTVYDFDSFQTNATGSAANATNSTAMRRAASSSGRLHARNHPRNFVTVVS